MKFKLNTTQIVLLIGILVMLAASAYLFFSREKIEPFLFPYAQYEWQHKRNFVLSTSVYFQPTKINKSAPVSLTTDKGTLTFDISKDKVFENTYLGSDLCDYVSVSKNFKLDVSNDELKRSQKSLSMQIATCEFEDESGYKMHIEKDGRFTYWDEKGNQVFPYDDL